MHMPPLLLGVITVYIRRLKHGYPSALVSKSQRPDGHAGPHAQSSIGYVTCKYAFPITSRCECTYTPAPTGDTVVWSVLPPACSSSFRDCSCNLFQ
ncbi:hypothetical protein PGT21_008153 [Puccinia graminis f. sp. tritici]|uniref:Uncharacterized protein n=1 Tax=Puccinia graminis f. sp. tritici TaxID=56615 RepID=A0A5B0LSZ0_PUCGR|nr:hypothetical protein PGT21_008153 [Puccinia graminis f. sp. tritici]KAA1092225.1 hypothetical protein PGTUg99_023129 [Puccinia graminis f. sp. tritici]